MGAAMPDVRHVQVSFDPDVEVWWAESDEVPGLVSEAPTQEELMDRVVDAAPELLAANGEEADGMVLRFVVAQPVQSDRMDRAQFA